MIGKTLAHYEITELIGKGGMGEVYRARDTKLGRDVALKLLPEDVSKDPERIARFEREAKVLASLSHPNIAALYGLEEVDSRVFLTMELAEGQDLSKRIQRAPIPVDEAIQLARRIAEGLEAAHAKGIVHRDLKPANVMVSAEGQVKLLDFGLARAYQSEDASGDPSASPTLTAAMTQLGVILGTAAYISPEQARGKSVDKQTDVWAFGVVFFEMLTGHRLFDGETISDCIGAILNRDPDWSLLPAGTPLPVRRLLRRCLERDRALRLRDIGDALVELHDAGEENEVVAPSAKADVQPWRHRLFLPWMVAVVALAIVVAILLTRGTVSVDLPLRKLTILPITDAGDVGRVRLSPDGRRVAYLARDAVWIRELDQTTPRRVSDARGFGRAVSCWSPDCQWLAFANDEKLWKAPMDGSAPTMICEIPTDSQFIAAAWDAQNRIVLAKWRGGLLEVSAGGGAIRELMKAPDDLVDYHDLALLPDGETLIATAHLVVDSSRVDLIREGGIFRSVALNSSFGGIGYSPSGHIVYAGAANGVWAAPFSLDELETTGEAFVVDADGTAPSVASDGSLVYSRYGSGSPGQIVRIDMSGSVSAPIGSPGEATRELLLSPSGSVLAYTAEEKGNLNLWTLDLESGATRRVTNFKESEYACDWSADGSKLLFARRSLSNWAAPQDGLYLVDLDVGEAPSRVSDGRSGRFLPDGSGVIYWKFDVRNEDRLYWKLFASDAEPQPFVDAMSQAADPSISPDGRVVAFESDESGTIEVWVARFPGGEGRTQISSGGGSDAVWSGDGRTLYYHGSENDLYAVSVTGGVRPSFGRPQRLFDGQAGNVVFGRGYDAFPDGSGFIAIQRLPLEDAAIVYVQNWASEFQQQR